jgi:translation initiation factor IF-2
MSNLRPPVVVVLGHVDHGKTTLLDSLRKTSVAAREAGGITQSIGASVVGSDGNRITFIDTPGHALFANMRSRGANFADIAVLVVAGDDGVQPQTKEAVNLIRTTNTPFVVAITKMDLPTANLENVLGQLEKEGVYFEKRGGDTPYVAISAKTQDGIKELLEMISLIWEVSEKKNTGELEGFVIETSKDKKGVGVTVVVKDGKIKIGDTVYAGKNEAKIKGLFDWLREPVREIEAGFPGEILGFEELPKAGARITSKPTDEVNIAERIGDVNGLAIYLKAKTAGSLEALMANLPEGVSVVGSGVGEIIQNDVFLAKARGADIYVFESKVPPALKKLGEAEGVKIERFDVIYALIEKLQEIITGGKEEITGRAQVLAIFPFNGKKVAGSKILQGKMTRGDKIRVERGGKEIGKARIMSIKKQKEDINEAKQGEECGIIFEPQVAFTIGDVLISVK